MKNFEKGGFKFSIRENTLDEYIVKEVIGSRCYSKKINITPEDVVLDAGANIGAFTVQAANIAHVISYEPNDDNCQLLLQNVVNNSLQEKVRIIKKALVGNDETERTFFTNNKTNKGSHSFFVKRGRSEEKVNCENINSPLNEFGITIIKMDIEGGEYECLKAIKDWSNIREIVLEFHHLALKDKDHSKFKEVIQILNNNFSQVNYLKDIEKRWISIINAKK